MPVQTGLDPVSFSVQVIVDSIAPAIQMRCQLGFAFRSRLVGQIVEALVHLDASGVESLVDSIAEPIPEPVSRKNRSRDCDHRRGESTH